MSIYSKNKSREIPGIPGFSISKSRFPGFKKGREILNTTPIPSPFLYSTNKSDPFGMTDISDGKAFFHTIFSHFAPLIVKLVTAVKLVTHL